MHPTPGLVCSGRPEGRVLSCLDSPSTQTVGLCSRVGHGSTVSSPSGSPCPLVSLQKSRRAHLHRYGKWASVSSTVSSMARAREQLCDHRDLVLGSSGKRASLPVQRNTFLSMELDSVSWWRVSPTSVPSPCWPVWVPSEAAWWYHWNTFRGSWGIWHPQPQSSSLDWKKKTPKGGKILNTDRWELLKCSEEMSSSMYNMGHIMCIIIQIKKWLKSCFQNGNGTLFDFL